MTGEPSVCVITLVVKGVTGEKEWLGANEGLKFVSLNVSPT